jgi:hypothetical protein
MIIKTIFHLEQYIHFVLERFQHLFLCSQTIEGGKKTFENKSFQKFLNDSYEPDLVKQAKYFELFLRLIINYEIAFL